MGGKSTSNFEVRAAAHLADLGLPMVDYLCRSKLLIPSSPGSRGRGRRRLYSFGDVVVLRAIARLLKHGISVTRLKVALAALRKHHPEITPTSLPASLLVTDGRTVFLRRGRDVAEDLARGQLTFAFVLDLSQIRGEVVSKLAEVQQLKFWNPSRVARA
jgi:DNA-binding transcriptional MerR regulator